MRNKPIAQWRSVFFFAGQILVLALQLFILMPVGYPPKASIMLRAIVALHLPLFLFGVCGSLVFAVIAFVRCKGPISLAFLLAVSSSFGLLASAISYAALFVYSQDRDLGVWTVLAVQLGLSVVAVWLSFVIIWFQKEPPPA